MKPALRHQGGPTLDPVLSLLGELATVSAMCDWLDEIVAEFDSEDLLADPVAVGFGEGTKLIHREREILEIWRRHHADKSSLNAQVVKLGLRHRQIENSREQAALVLGILQGVLSDPGVGIPRDVRSRIQIALADRLRSPESLPAGHVAP